ncbi:Arylsulfatase [Rubripirellula tenax]|uniref:Arylsulfatase n=1 Tax=Rubripirellula tenax TaxID=2528015 RepID=A0A5C6F4F7_9BACT|nr:sulfatase-like hydrolase/transferase [Rubripirellula tenax]TWU54689.1 Arylsulfatase [Rubripirellula tenax]
MVAFAAIASQTYAIERPNIILVFADDISARELPLYGSSVWSPPSGGNTSEVALRAQTPAIDQMAAEGCWVKTAWASVVCSPSRAMMMTGRYAHLHKWWNNKDKGRYIDANGKSVTWPLYKSSPRLIGHVAQQAGYATYWAGKTQMAGDLREFGFDQGCFTPGELADTDNPFTDFKMYEKKVDGKKHLFNSDTDQPIDTYLQHGWYWNPHVRLMKHAGKLNGFQWWPNTAESKKTFGLNTYGPDVELDFIFDFMDRQQADGKPFFVYHTSHLGHDAFDWLNPESPSKWPGTPVVKWDGKGYTRTDSHVTGDKGVYDVHGTVTEPGIHNHVNYLDYQIWLYRNKLQELGIADNTVMIFCADNGTSGYGKSSSDRQKGTHVPLIILAPGMTKHGRQDVLVSMADMLPTIADLTGTKIPSDYEVNGDSFVPFLFTDKTKHRDWIYGYNGADQIIRGDLVMKDGKGKWWDVSAEPDDLISFPEIKDWNVVSDDHRNERDTLRAVLPQFNLHANEHDAPGVDLLATAVKPKHIPKPVKTVDTSVRTEPNASSNAGERKLLFADKFDGRTRPGEQYTIARGTDGAWTIRDGVLYGRQTNDDHGAVIRKPMNFKDIDIEFDFRFNGGSHFNFVLDDQNEKSVHSGHICRVSISPKMVSVSDDKSGSMNLEVRKQRQDKNLSEEGKAALEATLAATQASAPVSLKGPDWHHARIQLQGDTLAVSIDGKSVVHFESSGISHPTKSKFGMTVNGSTIDFDNLQVFSIQP